MFTLTHYATGLLFSLSNPRRGYNKYNLHIGCNKCPSSIERSFIISETQE